MKINEILEENPNVVSLSVLYTDEYKTLHQSFMVTKKEVIESEGKVLSYLISQINPNLNWLYGIVTFGEEKKPIKKTYFNQDGTINKTMIYDEVKGWITNE